MTNLWNLLDLATRGPLSYYVYTWYPIRCAHADMGMDSTGLA